MATARANDMAFAGSLRAAFGADAGSGRHVPPRRPIVSAWHYPVQAEDGLVFFLEEDHRREAAKRGVDDEENWGKYARVSSLPLIGRKFLANGMAYAIA